MKVHIVGTLDFDTVEELGGKVGKLYEAAKQAHAANPHGTVIIGWDGEHEGQQELRALPTSGRQTPPATPPIDLRFWVSSKGNSDPTTSEFWAPMAAAISQAIEKHMPIGEIDTPAPRADYWYPPAYDSHRGPEHKGVEG